MYIQRHMEVAVKRYAAMFGAVLVTGSRQVGKTTLLKNVTDCTYVTLDDPVLLQSALNEGGTFFKDWPPPVFVDEIQYAPGLFPYIKIILDRDHKKGQFFLSGSQQFNMMKNVSESLAGRIGILHLAGLSLRERGSVQFNLPFIPTEAYFTQRKNDLKEVSYKEMWCMIHHGCMPELAAQPEIEWQAFYAAYVKTYVERDVRSLTQVGDELKFFQFMTALAASIGQLANLASIARDVGISQPTAVRWLSILRTSNIVCLLQPYHNNITKRAIKTPKIYFMDTGLAAYLTRWLTPETLQIGAQAGAFFENFVITEIFKSYTNAGVLEPPLYFYRDKEQREIDLLIQEGNTFHPVEIKKHADPDRKDAAIFELVDKIPGILRGSGGVICTYDHLITLKDGDRVIPMKYL